MPVSIALFDLGDPAIPDEEGETNDGSISIPADDNGTVKEIDQS